MIVGCGDTDDEAEADHDRNLKAFLERARERNLHLNADRLKVKIHHTSPTLDIYSQAQDCVDPRKVEAIEKTDYGLSTKHNMMSSVSSDILLHVH